MRKITILTLYRIPNTYETYSKKRWLVNSGSQFVNLFCTPQDVVCPLNQTHLIIIIKKKRFWIDFEHLKKCEIISSKFQSSCTLKLYRSMLQFYLSTSDILLSGDSSHWTCIFIQIICIAWSTCIIRYLRGNVSFKTTNIMRFTWHQSHNQREIFNHLPTCRSFDKKPKRMINYIKKYYIKQSIKNLHKKKKTKKKSQKKSHAWTTTSVYIRSCFSCAPQDLDGNSWLISLEIDCLLELLHQCTRINHRLKYWPKPVMSCSETRNQAFQVPSTISPM